MAVLRFLSMCLCVLVVIPFPSSTQPINFVLPKLSDLPSPGDLFNKFQTDMEQIKNDFSAMKAEMDELEMPPIDWDAMAEVREAVLEYMNDPKGNCDKIPHGKSEDPEVHMTPVSGR